MRHKRNRSSLLTSGALRRSARGARRPSGERGTCLARFCDDPSENCKQARRSFKRRNFRAHLPATGDDDGDERPTTDYQRSRLQLTTLVYRRPMKFIYTVARVARGGRRAAPSVRITPAGQSRVRSLESAPETAAPIGRRGSSARHRIGFPRSGGRAGGRPARRKIKKPLSSSIKPKNIFPRIFFLTRFRRVEIDELINERGAARLPRATSVCAHCSRAAGACMPRESALCK